MLLAIMRHGEAGFATSDELRPLTEQGRGQVLAVAKQLKKYSFDRIMSSPYLRARQTAEVVADCLQLNVSVQAGFTPSDRADQSIYKLPETGNSLLVSHMPLVSSLSGLLVHGNERNGHVFRPSEAIILEMELPAPNLGSFKTSVY